MNGIAHRHRVGARVLIRHRPVRSPLVGLTTRRKNMRPAAGRPTVIDSDASHDRESPAVEARPRSEGMAAGQCPLDGLLDEVLRIRILGPHHAGKSTEARKKLHKSILKLVQSISPAIVDETSEPCRFIP